MDEIRKHLKQDRFYVRDVCPNCKRLNSEHNEKEFLYCTKKILKDLVLDDENRRRMIYKKKN